MSIETPLFPCWGKHARMGHTTVIGEFKPFIGTIYEFFVPELPADPATFRKGSPARRGLVPMDGPAFFGFDRMEEGEAMAALMAGREMDWIAKEEARADQRLIASSLTVEEIRTEAEIDRDEW